MSLESRTTSLDPVAASVASDGVVCPFCAHVRPAENANGACPKCTMEDTAGTRRSTGERIGPWFVLQRRNPTAPGLRFSVLLTLARRGHVTPKSIVRGPTTGQLWRYAIQVKGLSRVFGACWHCQRSVSPDATTCPHCRSAQEIPDDPDTFLESHAMLPVMREVPTPTFSSNELTRETPAALPDESDEEKLPRELSADERALVRSLNDDRAPLPTRRNRGGAIVPTGREAGESIMSASELASIFQIAPPPATRTRRVGRGLKKLAKVSLLLVLVTGLAGTAVLYFKPDWRAQAIDRADPIWAKAKSTWNDLLARAGYGPTTTPVAPTLATGLPPTTPIQLEEKSKPLIGPEVTPGPVAVTTTPQAKSDASAESSRITLTPHEGVDATTDSVWATQTTKEATPSVVDLTPPSLSTPRPPTTSTPPATPAEIDALAGQASFYVPTTRPAFVPSPRVGFSTPTHDEVPPVVNGPSKEPSLEDAIKQATELRSSALDAEARKDWKGAVAVWEQIGTLPEAARPSDLKVRLQLARERLAGN